MTALGVPSLEATDETTPLQLLPTKQPLAAYELALLRRDLVRSRGFKPCPRLDLDRFHVDPAVTVRPWQPSPGWLPGSGQANLNARLATFGKPVGPKFTAACHAPFDDPETFDEDSKEYKKEHKKELKKLLNPERCWAFDDPRWDDYLFVSRPPVVPVAPAPQHEHWCRECWHEGIMVPVATDPIRPWQRPWHLCEAHSTKERRRRSHARSRVPCVACGTTRWVYVNGKPYKDAHRTGCALDETCWKAWQRSRKGGMSWEQFARMRAKREHAYRVLMSLDCEWASGDISPAWQRYLQRAIGRNHNDDVRLVLKAHSGTVVPLGWPVAVLAPSHNGSARAASFVCPHAQTLIHST